MCGYCNAGGQCTCYTTPRAEKSVKDHFPFFAFFHEQRKFSSGFWENSADLVHWGCRRLVIHSAHECKYGCDFPEHHTSRYAGTGLFLPQYITVFTIPIGFLMGGLLVDKVFEPLMAALSSNSFLVPLFGDNKGSGAAMLFFIIGIAGVLVCLIFNFKLQKYKWNENTGSR